MKKFIFLICCFCSIANAQERPRVVVPSDEDREVSEFLECLKDSIDNEDYRAYSSLLTKEYAAKNKKKNALMFLENDLGVELGKFTILESDEEHIVFVASYVYSIGNQSCSIVSEINTKRTDEGLLLGNEEIISKKRGSSGSSDVGLLVEEEKQDECPNGQCPIVAKKQKNQDRDESVPIFENNGNGPMWLDPRILYEKFPDRYPKPCIKCK